MAATSQDLDDADALVVPVVPGTGGPGEVLIGPGPGSTSPDADAVLSAVARLGMSGAAGEICSLGPDAVGRLRFAAGFGDGSAAAHRRTGAALSRALLQTSCRKVGVTLADDPVKVAGAFVVGYALGSFGYRMGDEPAPSAPDVLLADLDDEAQRALGRAVATAAAGWHARTLATVPSNVKNPPWLAEHARAVADEESLTCRVWDEHELAAGGFGGLIGVGQASATPPRLVRLDYTPPGTKRGDAAARPIVLVGKGITFDSGGLSIKPGQAMSTMKRDMSGAAVVLATMAALAETGCEVPVIGLLACAENAVDGNAIRPGDVITHFGGRTSEVTNTDAEGRLVMADAIAYAVAELDPAVVVDVATLTGAVKVALGQQVGGMFSSVDWLADALLTAGRGCGERLWRLPLHAGYRDRLKSSVADADNAAGGPGAITAALFLQPFVGQVPWAHLDLASVGDAPEDLDEWTAGPTGFGSRVLLEWLSDDPLAGAPS